MRILLLMPPVYVNELHPDILTKKNKFWDFLIGEKGLLSGKHPVTGRQPPFGLLYLSAVLKQHNHEVDLIDGFFNTDEKTLKWISDNNIKCVGITCVSYNWVRAKDLAKKIKHDFPDTKVIVGGPHPTVWKEKCLEESNDIDVVVYGEGEYTLLEVLDKFDANESLKGVKSTIIKDGKKVITNPPRELIKNIDTLPIMDRDIINMWDYQPSPLFYKRLPWTAIFASRGCPFCCTFCHSDRRVRLRSNDDVIKEIEYVIKKYGIKDLTFYDETFTLNKKRVIDFCNEIIRRKLDIVWSVNARVDTVDLGILHKMKEAGCWRILYGIESGVQKNLNRMKKGITLEQVRKAVNLTKKVGIESYGMFMFGLPGETFELGMETIKFACSLPLGYAAFVAIIPLPGTELYEEVHNEQGWKGLEHLHNGAISYVSNDITEEQLSKLVRISYRKFYLRPKYILSRLMRIRSLEDIKRDIRGFLLLIT